MQGSHKNKPNQVVLRPLSRELTRVRKLKISNQLQGWWEGWISPLFKNNLKSLQGTIQSMSCPLSSAQLSLTHLVCLLTKAFNVCLMSVKPWRDLLLPVVMLTLEKRVLVPPLLGRKLSRAKPERPLQRNVHPSAWPSHGETSSKLGDLGYVYWVVKGWVKEIMPQRTN